MKTTNTVAVIDKMLVSELTFPEGDVLNSEEAKQERSIKLHNATSLGNLNKHKVKITFEDNEGLKQVHTTIWAITDKKILLKADRSLPIERIHQVRLS